jgi:N-acetylmuramic acid 6-phosphate etherase
MRDGILTEEILESTRDLDRRSVAEILEAIHGEDRRAFEAVGEILPEIARAVDVLVLVLQGGGRWFNVGAGTSGRMGALDASEVPPTFGYPHDRVQGVIAGGPTALWRAVEGAEDDAAAARQALEERDVLPGDAVVALSASGQTPYAVAALEYAREIGARRLAITCDPDSPLAGLAEVALTPLVGPEVIAGSTRMKGGLAQKMVLHLLSTTVMVRLGRVEGNQMTNLLPASRKLRARGLRILMELGRAALAGVAGVLLRRGASASAEGAHSEAKPSEAAVDPGSARIRTRKWWRAAGALPRREPLLPEERVGEEPRDQVFVVGP